MGAGESDTDGGVEPLAGDIMTEQAADDPERPITTDSPGSQAYEYQEGKRAGAHPIVVIISVILGLWFVLWLYVPSSRHRQATRPPATPSQAIDTEGASDVMFRVEATLPNLNVVTIVVPPQATDSQVVGLLARLRKARLDNTLNTLIPPTTPGHPLGANAVAEIYVFSDSTYAQPEAVEVLARGAHAPGDLYPQAIPFEVAMEQVRGHYRIDLDDPGNPDAASLGFADDSGVHSSHYQPVF